MKYFLLLLLTTGSLIACSQDSTDILKSLDADVNKSMTNQREYVRAAFKTTRLIDGHTIENTAPGVMDLKVSHRFGTLNSGAYEFFGLDNATMRIGLDFGLTRTLMIGFGRSTYQKTFDAFAKYKLLSQSTGYHSMPVTVSYVPTIAITSLKVPLGSLKMEFGDRLSYTHQLLIGRKFSEGLSLQVMPTLIHNNMSMLATDHNDIWACGIGGRQKISRRVSINAEYYYVFPGTKLPGTTNCLSLGFDIETGGHVFQLHFTNSRSMIEKGFISETTGSWGKGDIQFGFNISRVFTISKKRRK